MKKPLEPEMNSTWCPLPWVHLSYSNRGALRLCSHSRSLGDLNTYSDSKTESFLENRNSRFLNEVRSSMQKNEWHSVCERCKKDSEAGMNSRIEQERQRFSSYFNQEQASLITAKDGSLIEEPPLLSIDLRLGNRCNFKCVMCYPGESHKLYKDYALGTGEWEFDDHGQKIEITQSSSGHFEVKDSPYDWVDSDDVYNLIESKGDTLKKVFIAGGEPFLLEKHLKLLDKISLSPNAKNLELEYSTNLSVLPNPIPEYWQKFKSVRLGVSLDGQGVVNEAIRYGSQWGVLVDNLRRLDQSPSNINVHISTTLSILNIEHLPSWLKWVRDQKFQKIAKNPLKTCALHPVYSPQMLSLRLLSDLELKSLRSLWDKTLNSISENHKDQVEIESQILPFLEWAKTSLSKQEQIIAKKRLFKYMDYISEQRNQNWTLISPWFFENLKNWKETHNDSC